MDTQWAICIDIEGFSKNYEHSEERKTFAILALGELMQSIYAIATNCYPGDPDKHFADRLFAYQFGDGFLICSNHETSGTGRAVAITIAIMRHMMMNGYPTKAAISLGSMSDIHGCYPKSIRDGKDNRVDMGMGLMTTISVMGTALTKAHKLAATRSGAVLVLDDVLLEAVAVEMTGLQGRPHNCIDWVSSDIPLVEQIVNKAALSCSDPAQLLESLKAYCDIDPKPPESWVKGTFSAIHE